MDPTHQLLPNGKGGGFNRSAHSAGPGNGRREMGKREGERVKGKGTSFEERDARCRRRFNAEKRDTSRQKLDWIVPAHS